MKSVAKAINDAAVACSRGVLASRFFYCDVNEFQTQCRFETARLFFRCCVLEYGMSTSDVCFGAIVGGQLCCYTEFPRCRRSDYSVCGQANHGFDRGERCTLWQRGVSNTLPLKQVWVRLCSRSQRVVSEEDMAIVISIVSLAHATCDRVAFWRVGITRLSVHVLCKHKQCCCAAVKEGDFHQVRAL